MINGLIHRDIVCKASEKTEPSRGVKMTENRNGPDQEKLNNFERYITWCG